MQKQFAVVDLFAGPGGLAEGFASIRDEANECPFRVVLSVEKEASAFETLRLRSFLRQFTSGFPREYYDFLNGEIPEPNWSQSFPEQWESACHEAIRLELGSTRATQEVDRRLADISMRHGKNVILIGGPPCQAYSLVGRARNKGTEGYNASKDHRHFLYREYIRILQRLMPAAFVMENVKGLLSSSVDGERVFDKVLADLGSVGKGAYKLFPLAPRTKQAILPGMELPSAFDFVVRAEDHGIPQSRHRVIIVGIRSDVAMKLDEDQFSRAMLPKVDYRVTVRDVLGQMPKLRSGLSKSADKGEVWKTQVSQLMRRVANSPSGLAGKDAEKFRKLGEKRAASLERAREADRGVAGVYSGVGSDCPVDLKRWLIDSRLRQFSNNETRGHMAADLGRYFFAALYAQVMNESPKAKDFPKALAPDHKNWKSGKFADRFRVQLWKSPATTVTSHISKDGHYFIHPDPAQCRSLTVREAARLQTFPDNYLFKGNRTQQYVQVGNAVPPYLAKKIASALFKLLSPSLSLPHRGKREIQAESETFCQ
ncbi:DNA (cytosine-5-)-methyltransferase [Bradyrhizobium tropiciagri]|uniref:DNA cytosine methyltransferase n=1 Tax=Bradyrhizobium tropiciagri TaxID=312253 RepID=UPI001BA7933D|nr:DNA (cytosine-5-)-methyltransferase [Bradyrhizobium tropiciagri]MBR0899578.1 DNA (cytosine-5-)-methyltransferase [Bradyrhizobium tropiciagri]